MNTIEAKKLAHQLRAVTDQMERYFGNDVHITYRLLSRLMAFESRQHGFGLTATQDAHFNEVSPFPMTQYVEKFNEEELGFLEGLFSTLLGGRLALKLGVVRITLLRLSKYSCSSRKQIAKDAAKERPM